MQTIMEPMQTPPRRMGGSASLERLTRPRSAPTPPGVWAGYDALGRLAISPREPCGLAQRLPLNHPLSDTKPAFGAPKYYSPVSPACYKTAYNEHQGTSFAPSGSRSASSLSFGDASQQPILGTHKNEAPCLDRTGRPMSPQRPVSPMDAEFRHYSVVPLSVYKERNYAAGLLGNVDNRLPPPRKLPAYATKPDDDAAKAPAWVGRLNTPFTRFRAAPAAAAQARKQQPQRSISRYDAILYR
jgi:hypothetical protein